MIKFFFLIFKKKRKIMQKILETIFASKETLWSLRISVIELEVEINKRSFFNQLKNYLYQILDARLWQTIKDSNDFHILGYVDDDNQLSKNNQNQTPDDFIMKILISTLLNPSQKNKELVKLNFRHMLHYKLENIKEQSDFVDICFKTIQEKDQEIQNEERKIGREEEEGTLKKN